ncbi:MAG: AbrB/MazE/SpoVT family DNA-binding domain-containing protein [Acidimicrobiales bacterium]
MEIAARVTSKGQVTIPAPIRQALGLNAGDEVIFQIDPEPGPVRAQVRKAPDFLALAGSVPVPRQWADADWPSLRAAAWSSQVALHNPDP